MTHKVLASLPVRRPAQIMARLMPASAVGKSRVSMCSPVLARMA